MSIICDPAQLGGAGYGAQSYGIIFSLKISHSNFLADVCCDENQEEGMDNFFGEIFKLRQRLFLFMFVCDDLYYAYAFSH